MMYSYQSGSVSESKFLTPDFYQDPYSFYRELQSHDPVYWSEKKQAWLITKYSLVSEGLRNPLLSVRRDPTHSSQLPETTQQEIASLKRFYSLWMMYLDSPDHDRIRKLVNKAFIPRVLEATKHHTEMVVNSKLDNLIANGKMDLLSEFANPITIATLANMLDVPSQDYYLIKKWSDDLVGFLGIGAFDLEKARTTQQSMDELSSYLLPLFAQRKENKRNNDLLSLLINANENGSVLSNDELLATYANILIDGHEPVANVIGNGILAFLEYPEQLQLLRKQPELLDASIEEIIRYNPPFQYSGRVATQDFNLGEKEIKAGDRVLLMLGALLNKGA